MSAHVRLRTLARTCAKADSIKREKRGKTETRSIDPTDIVKRFPFALDSHASSW